MQAGTGVVRRASAACREGVAGLEVNKLKTVFLTHLHSDHTIGLPDLLLKPWFLERHEPIVIYDRPGTRAMLSHLAKAYREDIRMRTRGLEPANRPGIARWSTRSSQASSTVTKT